MPPASLVDHQPDDVLRVALYAGVAYQRDAVSNSFVEKLRILTRLGEQGHPVEVTGFALASDCGHQAVRVVSGLSELMCRPEFAAADLHIFEFGMWYELFNALFLIDKPSLVIDHNTTPPELIDEPEVRLACERSQFERNNLTLANHIATISEFTRDGLVEMGFAGEQISVLHLPPANAAPTQHRSEAEWTRPGEPVHLLYVGRFVRAKGILDLLDAAGRLWDAGVDGFRLTMAGSIRFADPATMAAVEQARALHAGSGRLTMIFDADDHEMTTLYAGADALVMPSYHEGFCVPVIEALASGCYVIGSDAGNVPNVMGGLGTSFATGQVTDLVRAIEEFVTAVARARSGQGDLALPTDSGVMRLGPWQRAVATHLADYTYAHFEQGFLNTMVTVLQEAPFGPPEWLSALVDRSAAVPARAS